MEIDWYPIIKKFLKNERMEGYFAFRKRKIMLVEETLKYVGMDPKNAKMLVTKPNKANSQNLMATHNLNLQGRTDQQRKHAFKDLTGFANMDYMDHELMGNKRYDCAQTFQTHFYSTVEDFVVSFYINHEDNPRKVEISAKTTFEKVFENKDFFPKMKILSHFSYNDASDAQGYDPAAVNKVISDAVPGQIERQLKYECDGISFKQYPTTESNRFSFNMIITKYHPFLDTIVNKLDINLVQTVKQDD